MNTLAIIPARGGSKGIPRKNVMDFCGKPLIAWSILQAREAGLPVLVTTDDEEIGEVARDYGASVVEEPESLAGPKSRVELALMHALNRRRDAQTIVFLQATSPVREAEWITDALSKFDHDSMFSAYPLFPFVWRHDLSSANYDPSDRPMRQDHNPMLVETGSFYIFKRDLLFRTGARLGGKIGAYIVDNMIEIDEPEDVPEAEWWMQRKLQT